MLMHLNFHDFGLFGIRFGKFSFRLSSFPDSSPEFDVWPPRAEWIQSLLESDQFFLHKFSNVFLETLQQDKKKSCEFHSMFLRWSCTTRTKNVEFKSDEPLKVTGTSIDLLLMLKKWLRPGKPAGSITDLRGAKVKWNISIFILPEWFILIIIIFIEEVDALTSSWCQRWFQLGSRVFGWSRPPCKLVTF